MRLAVLEPRYVRNGQGAASTLQDEPSPPGTGSTPLPLPPPLDATLALDATPSAASHYTSHAATVNAAAAGYEYAPTCEPRTRPARRSVREAQAAAQAVLTNALTATGEWTGLRANRERRDRVYDVSSNRYVLPASLELHQPEPRVSEDP